MGSGAPPIVHRTAAFSICDVTLEHALQRLVFLATGSAADQLNRLQISFCLQTVSLLGMPHAIVRPGANMLRIGGKCLLIPELRVVIAPEFPAGIAEIVCHVRMIVLLEDA